MREETEKLKITDKNCLDREQYGTILKEMKVLVENKEKRKGTAWSKERKQRHAEIMRRYWDKRKAKMGKAVLWKTKKNIQKLYG